MSAFVLYTLSSYNFNYPLLLFLHVTTYAVLTNVSNVFTSSVVGSVIVAPVASSSMSIYPCRQELTVFPFLTRKANVMKLLYSDIMT